MNSIHETELQVSAFTSKKELLDLNRERMVRRKHQNDVTDIKTAQHVKLFYNKVVSRNSLMAGYHSHEML